MTKAQHESSLQNPVFTTVSNIVFSTIASYKDKMYRYLPRYGKYENENMQNYFLDLVNFDAHLSKILKYDISG